MAVTDPHEAPSDVVFVELGKLAWAAINLEDVVYSVCHVITPTDTYHDIPIGRRITDAVDALSAQPDTALRSKASAWLEAASAALTERNAVMHGIPVTFVPLSPDITPGNLDPDLAHFPRDKSRMPVHTALTVAGLRPVTRRIETARFGWDELAVELYEMRFW